MFAKPNRKLWTHKEKTAFRGLLYSSQSCHYWAGIGWRVLFAELQFEVSGLQKLIYTKKGVPLILKYFFINEMLWNDNLLLCYYIDLAYKAAVEELCQKQHSHIRIKDLPNMNMSIERALGKVGISDVDYLKMLGAKVCYLKLRQKKVNLSIKLLFELAGAIEGYHIAVLPESIKIELITWYNSLT